MTGDSEFRGKIAVITGGGGGFGKAFGLALAALGAHAILIDRDGAAAESAAAEIKAAGGAAIGYAGDVTDEARISEIMASTASALGGIRVNAISPGLILTEVIAAELAPEVKARVKAMQFIDADGAEQDIVDAMLYLASSKARFVTGETLRVTGGAAAGI